MSSPEELIGIELTGFRGRYKLEKFLGEGLTANVYMATATWRDFSESEQVAVKVMRPGLGGQEAFRYRAEAMHLSELLSAKAEAAPIFYERFETGRVDAPEALALELIRGRKVVDLLLADGPFVELDGLSLGLQLAKLLHTLHQEIGRTYTDFKFENLWWQHSERQLKVTDWNVVSERGQLDRATVDLLRASRYLYTILTGGDAREQGGIVVTPFMHHPRWPVLSIACQNILRQGLHRYPDHRYQTAQEMVETLQRVLGYWQDAPDGLLLQVKRRIDAPYNRTTFEQAREILDVIRKREDQGGRLSLANQAQLDEFWNVVEERLNKEQNAIEIGWHQFNGGSWQEAERWFVQAIGENPWDLRSWRWREAARAGLVTSEYQGYKDDIAEGVDALNNGEYVRAEQRLTRYAIPALDGLVAEARLRRLLQEGVRLTTQGKGLVDQGMGDTGEADDIFNRAQRAFLGAADALNTVTPKDYREQLQQDPEIGDPAKRGRELVDQRRAAAAAAGLLLRGAEDKARNGDWPGAIQDLTAGLEAVPGEVRLLSACLRYGQEQLRIGQPHIASDLLALASRYDAPGARRWWRAAAGAAACSLLLGESRWIAGLDVLEETIALQMDAEVQNALAGPLQRALEAALASAAASASLPELLHLLTVPTAVARLDSGLTSWVEAIDQRWAELVALNIETRLPPHPVDVLEQAETAVKAAPSDAIKMQLAGRLIEPLTRALALVPASGDVNQATRALAGAERLLVASRELRASVWLADVESYRAELAQTQEMRREARFEEDRRLIESLMKAGDKWSLEQARERLEEAQRLTPAESSQAERLAVMQGRLAKLEDILLSGAERRNRIVSLLTGFDARLAQARSEPDFASLDKDLVEAQRQVQSLQDSDLIDTVTAKLNLERAIRNRRGEVERLEQVLAYTRARIGAADTLGDMPGGAAAKHSLWRQLNATAAVLLDAHPGHSDAVQAQQDYRQAVGALALLQRVAYVETVTAELGEPFQQYLQADAHYRAAQPERASQFLDNLSGDWQELEKVQNLSRRIDKGTKYLAHAERLKLIDPLDDRFDQELISVLRTDLPSDYLAKSGLDTWSQTRRTAAVQAWAGLSRHSAGTAPRLLSQLVAIDLAARLIGWAQQGKMLPENDTPFDVSPFVHKALTLHNDRDHSRSQVDNLLQELPLRLQPAGLGRQVETSAKEQLIDSVHTRRSSLVRLLAGVAGVLALLTLMAVIAGWLWPGFMPNSRPKLLAAAATATTNPPTPIVVRETVLVIQVATSTPQLTDTPTATPTQAVIPSPTEVPIYLDVNRIQGALTGINSPQRLPDVGSMTATVTISDVIGVLDDSDEGFVFNQEGVPGADLVNVADLGTLGNMHYLDLTTLTEENVPAYAWSPVTSVLTGTYRLLVFVPDQNGTADVGYKVELLKAGDQSLALAINETPQRLLSQARYTNAWVDVGAFKVVEPGGLRVLAKATPKNVAGDRAAFDAVAIIRMQ